MLLASLPGKRSPEAIKTYIESRSASLPDRPAFQALLTRFIERLLDGQALDVESVIDVLTLNDDPSRMEDAALALDRLSRDAVSCYSSVVLKADIMFQSLPEGRRQVALLSIWRRVFIHDE